MKSGYSIKITRPGVDETSGIVTVAVIKDETGEVMCSKSQTVEGTYENISLVIAPMLEALKRENEWYWEEDSEPIIEEVTE